MKPMRPAFSLPAFALGFSLIAGAQAPLHAQSTPIAPDARKYLQQFIDQLHNRSLYRDRVDWKQLETKAYAAAGGAQGLADLSPAIKVALTELGDRLGRYRPVTGAMVLPDLPRCPMAQVTPPDLPKTIGYVRVTPIPSSSMRVMGEAATQLQASIRRGDQDGAENWIVDLRGLGYGQAAPSLIGLGPLLGEGVVLYIEDTEGGLQPYRAGEQTMKVNGLPVQLAIDHFTLTHKKARVAVLTDGGTAGIGELVAIAFTARKDARSFGASTCGVSPFLSSAIKLKDGAELVLSGTVVVDRNRRRFPGVIDPDEKVDDAGHVVEHAVQWLTGGK